MSDENIDREVEVAVAIFETRIALESGLMAARFVARSTSAAAVKAELEIVVRLFTEASEAFEAMASHLEGIVNLHRLH